MSERFQNNSCGVVRRAVQVRGANAFHRVDVSEIEVVAPAEHQVLEQVGKAGLAELLVLGSYVVPRVHRHDRGRVEIQRGTGPERR